MKEALDQTIIKGLQIFLDHRSLSSMEQKILMTPPPPPFPIPPFSILVGHWRLSGCLLSPIHHLLSYYLSVILSFSLSVSISMLHLTKVPTDGAHVTDIRYNS